MKETGFEWVVPPDLAFAQLGEKYADDIHAGALALAEAYQPEIKMWMQVNAPWTDRTGMARQFLYVNIQEQARQFVRLIIGHGVWYGIHLELNNSGRYSIVNPAVDTFGAQIIEELRRMFKR